MFSRLIPALNLLTHFFVLFYLIYLENDRGVSIVLSYAVLFLWSTFLLRQHDLPCAYSDFDRLRR